VVLELALELGLALGMKALFQLTTLHGVTGLWAAVAADTGATSLVIAKNLGLLRWWR